MPASGSTYKRCLVNERSRDIGSCVQEHLDAFDATVGGSDTKPFIQAGDFGRLNHELKARGVTALQCNLDGGIDFLFVVVFLIFLF